MGDIAFYLLQRINKSGKSRHLEDLHVQVAHHLLSSVKWSMSF